MSNNTQLPVDVVDKIKQEASFYSGHNPDEDTTPFRNGYYSGYISGATEYAIKLQESQQLVERYEKAFKTTERIKADAEAYANKNPNALTKSISYQSYIAGAIAEVQWKVKHDELVQENEQLRGWKMEASELLAKIHSYAHKHLEVKLGQCNVEFTIAQAKERDELKARCDKMVQLVSKFIERFQGAAEMADQDIDSKLIKRAKKAIKGGLPELSEPILNNDDLKAWEESNNPAPVQGEKEVGNE